jgi:uncharacterized LabA/DUF88 family protein
MEQITYVFIDGNYVRKALDRAMMEVFGVAGDLAPEAIGPSDAFRSYFYDCLDDLKKGSESDAEFNARVEAQAETFSRMHSRKGLHLRLGTLKGGRRREQKEVDILLAVDMLTHGLNRNMTRAVLVSGDLDFRPVVEALVRSGIFVEVWYEKRSAAKELPGAADFGIEINWHRLYSWSTEDFRAKCRPPSDSMEHAPVVLARQLACGYCEGRNAELMQQSNHGPLTLRVERPDGVHWLEHHDRQVIERYFSTTYGAPIDWK